MSYHYLLDLALILLSTKLLGLLTQRFQMPQVVGALLAGCGLGAKLCGFTERESIQVGVGMVCRGEVALIVANRGLSMGVLSSAMMTPVVITVVGGTILTPILLKLVFRGEPQEKLVESSLADRYEKTAQLEDASQQLLDADAAMMRKNK